MMKITAALATAVALLAAGFVVLPKILLNAPGAAIKADDHSVPLGQTRSLPSATAIAGLAGAGTPVALQIEEFQAIQSAAGFTPLTPASLPGGYEERERYLRTGSRPAVVLSYRKPDQLYIFVVERKRDPGAQGFQRPDITGRQRPAGTAVAPYGQQPRVDIGGVTGVYTQGLSQTTVNALSGSVTPEQLRTSQLHSVLFNRGDVEVTVVADLNDVPRDQLIEIARGLH